MKKHFIVILGITVLLLFAVYSVRSTISDSADTNTKQLVTTFKSSDLMDLSIQLPQGFQAQDNYDSITLIRGESNIQILYNTTNHQNLRDFLTDPRLSLLEDMKMKSERMINGHTAISGILDNSKYVFIYHNNVVYSFKTDNPALYDELDKIANSFQYTPEN